MTWSDMELGEGRGLGANKGWRQTRDGGDPSAQRQAGLGRWMIEQLLSCRSARCARFEPTRPPPHPFLVMRS